MVYDFAEAYRHAPIIPVWGLQDLDKQVVSSFRNNNPQIRDLDSNYIDLRSSINDPSKLVVADLVELSNAVDAWGIFAGASDDAIAFQHKAALHEGQHAEAAFILGANAVSFGLETFMLEDKDKETYLAMRLFMHPHMKVSLLEFAAITAYPAELSEGDRASIQDIGIIVENFPLLASKKNHGRLRHGLPLLPMPLWSTSR